MTRQTSINVPLEQAEVDALRRVAANELRHPRDQARYLLRVGLGLAAPPALYATNPIAEVSQTAATGFAQRNL